MTRNKALLITAHCEHGEKCEHTPLTIKVIDESHEYLFLTGWRILPVGDGRTCECCAELGTYLFPANAKPIGPFHKDCRCITTGFFGTTHDKARMEKLKPLPKVFLDRIIACLGPAGEST